MNAPANFTTGDTRMKLGKFTLAATVLIALSVSAFASDKMRATVHIYEAVSVGSVQLAPGEYTIKWTETGSDAQVTFVQGKHTIGTVPAQLSQARSGYSNVVIETDTRANALTRIALPKESFSFATNSEISGN
jgi:hypothetical protein